MVRHFGYAKVLQRCGTCWVHANVCANAAPASAEGDGLVRQNPEFLWSVLLNQVDELSVISCFKS